MRSPAWVADSIWWHVYPLGALGADTTGARRDPGRTLADLVPWLDHLIDLGANGLALGPIFRSTTHGYDTVDHFAIDERLGTEADFDTLVAGCRERGIRLMLDGVFNHVGRDHPAFQSVLAEGPQSPYAEWFHLDWPPGAEPGTVPDHRTFEGHDALVALSHEAPAVRELVAEVMRHWLDRGADAWRLDAAYAVPAEHWAQILAPVRDSHPDAYLMGEVLHGDYADFVTSSGVHAVTQYELWKAVWGSLNDHNLFELDHALGRHTQFLQTFRPWTFVGNHDVTRLATQLEDRRHLPHALVVLATVGGTPAVYYGDELGLEGLKEDRPGGDDAIRPALPAVPEAPTDDALHVLQLHQQLIGLRRRHRWLAGATTECLHLTNEQICYRTASGDDSLLVALNLADEEATVPLPGGDQVVAGEARLEGAGGEMSARLPGHGWAVCAPRP